MASFILYTPLVITLLFIAVLKPDFVSEQPSAFLCLLRK